MQRLVTPEILDASIVDQVSEITSVPMKHRPRFGALLSATLQEARFHPGPYKKLRQRDVIPHLDRLLKSLTILREAGSFPTRAARAFLDASGGSVENWIRTVEHAKFNVTINAKTALPIIRDSTTGPFRIFCLSFCNDVIVAGGDIEKLTCYRKAELAVGSFIEVQDILKKAQALPSSWNIGPAALVAAFNHAKESARQIRIDLCSLA
jgi:hypothetical protein